MISFRGKLVTDERTDGRTNGSKSIGPTSQGSVGPINKLICGLFGVRCIQTSRTIVLTAFLLEDICGSVSAAAHSQVCWGNTKECLLWLLWVRADMCSPSKQHKKTKSSKRIKKNQQQQQQQQQQDQRRESARKRERSLKGKEHDKYAKRTEEDHLDEEGVIW